MTKPLLLDTTLLKKAALIYRAINHPLRLKILQYLHQKKQSPVTPIYVELRLVQAVASQHLAILRRAGLVKTERKGKSVIYTVDYEKLKELHNAAGILTGKKDSTAKL